MPPLEKCAAVYRQVQKEIKDDLKGASDAWKEMGHDGHQKASGVKVTRTVAAETPPNLEEKLLSIINQHPDGITLSDVAKELGIVTIVLGKAAKVLLEQGKIRKEEKIYFPSHQLINPNEIDLESLQFLSPAPSSDKLERTGELTKMEA